jgi:hypothetical protein
MHATIYEIRYVWYVFSDMYVSCRLHSCRSSCYQLWASYGHNRISQSWKRIHPGWAEWGCLVIFGIRFATSIEHSIFQTNTTIQRTLKEDDTNYLMRNVKTTPPASNLDLPDSICLAPRKIGVHQKWRLVKPYRVQYHSLHSTGFGQANSLLVRI